MKHSFSTGVHSKGMSLWLLLTRAFVGILMLTHGYPKLQQLMEGSSQFPDPLHISVHASLALTVFAEFVCSILLILGLATRFAAIPPLVVMLIAVFSIHANDPLNKKELAILYAVFYFGFLIFGAGKYSVDNFIGKKKR